MRRRAARRRLAREARAERAPEEPPLPASSTVEPLPPAGQPALASLGPWAAVGEGSDGGSLQPAAATAAEGLAVGSPAREEGAPVEEDVSVEELQAARVLARLRASQWQAVAADPASTEEELTSTGVRVLFPD
mmetsp:Transcript_18255/g.57440  ORF Transcript_18255/g.57440 Transcript_18255/m.57440 type:complete len:133 (+) Transcript_18255:526-924(+)